MTLYSSQHRHPHLASLLLHVKAVGIRDGWGRVGKPRGEKSEYRGRPGTESQFSATAPPHLGTCHFLHYPAQQWAPAFHIGGPEANRGTVH